MPHPSEDSEALFEDLLDNILVPLWKLHALDLVEIVQQRACWAFPKKGLRGGNIFWGLRGLPSWLDYHHQEQGVA